MSSLTQTAIIARKAVRYTIYGLVLLIVGRIALGAAYSAYRAVFPAPPPPPTVLFGRLPQIAFPENAADPATLTYTLQTADGKLPGLGSQSKVYFVPKELPTLFSVEKGLATARQLGFTGAREEVSQTLYKFRHPSSPKTLELNLVTNIFSLSYDLAGDPSAIDALPPTPEAAASQVRSYLASAGLLPEDLTGAIFHEYLRVEQGQLVPALSQSEAHITKINLTRGALDKLPSLGPNPDQANVWFLVSGSRTQEKKILAGEFHYVKLDTQRVSTYPIKTAAAAWEELTLGGGFISQAPANAQVVVRRVYLANYDPNKFEEFVQPIIVFEGDGFLAYVPAVSAEYYGR